MTAKGRKQLLFVLRINYSLIRCEIFQFISADQSLTLQV